MPDGAAGDELVALLSSLGIVITGPAPHAHLAVDADGRVLDAGVTYHGGILLAGSGGAATVAVYDGVDASGDLIDYFSAAASARDRGTIDRGLIIRRGLYVDLGSNVSNFTLYYDPVPQSRD